MNKSLFLTLALILYCVSLHALADDLAALSDEFDNAASQADWQRLNDVEGWNADQLEVWDVNTTRPGHMRMMPYTNAWFGDLRGPLVHKNITGDFVVTARMEIGSRGDMSLPPNRLFSLGGLFMHTPRGITSAAPTPATTTSVWPPAAHGSDWQPDTDNYVFLSYGSAGTPGTWQYEVKTTVNGTSTLYYDNSGVPDSNVVELQMVRVGQTVVVLRRHPGGNWIVENRYPNPDHNLPVLADTMQVGFTAYTDWNTIGGPFYNNGDHASQFHHNYSVLSGPGYQPDLIMDVDYIRFNRPPAELTEALLQALPTSYDPNLNSSTALYLPADGAGLYLGDNAAPSFSLTVTAGAGGTVTPEAPGSHSDGTVVNITATPDPGYVFSAWTGDHISSLATDSVTMDANKTIQATFIEDTADNDQDGLTNFQELVVYQTNPNQAQTTADGISDGDAVAAGLDPTTDYSAVITHIQSAPQNFSLYSEANIQDARMSGLMLTAVGTDHVDVQFEIQTSDDLGGSWTTTQTIQQTIPLPATKQFVRLQADGLPE